MTPHLASLRIQMVSVALVLSVGSSCSAEAAGPVLGTPLDSASGDVDSAEDLASTPAAMDGILGSGQGLPPARVAFEVHVGQRYLAQGLAATAAQHFRRVTEAAPGHPGGWLLLSRALAASNRLEDARNAAEKAVEIVEALPPAKREGLDVAEFYANLGRVLVATVQTGPAELALRKSLALRPDHARTLERLGLLHLEMGQDADAAGELRRVTEALPGHAPAWLGLGKALLRVDDFAGAEKALVEALRLNPDEPEIHYVLSSVYRGLGEHAKQDEQLAAFEKLRGPVEERRRKAQGVDARLQEAAVALSEGKFTEAAPTLEALLADPFVTSTGFRLARIRTDLALCRHEAGDHAAARGLYLAALAEKPESFVANFELGTLLAEDGNVDAGLGYLLQASAVNPFHPETHANLGRAWGLLGRLNDALGELRRAASLDPEDVAVRQELASLEWTLGHREQARGLASLGGVILPEEPEGTEPGSAPASGSPSPMPDPPLKRTWAR